MPEHGGEPVTRTVTSIADYLATLTLDGGPTTLSNATNPQYTRWGCRANVRRARSELGMRSSSRARFRARR
ncbi:MAG TPA: hypothetical protein VK899_05745 [Gemmatimonadales bacterium]|nr:hypothetical protein [Gemmatimonadales bacterium]